MLAGMTAVAADDTGITLTRNGRLAIGTKAPSTITPAQVNSPANKTISGNRSDFPFGIFFCCFGNTIAGINSALGFEAWVAIPFTPAANLKVHKVEASVDIGSLTEQTRKPRHPPPSGVGFQVLWGRGLTTASRLERSRFQL